MAMLPTVIARRPIMPSHRWTAVWFSALLWLGLCLPLAADDTPAANEGRFLVATAQLDGTSFQEAVILITHYSERGATGLTINRPTDIPLQDAFPHNDHLQQRTDPLYLGGPVSSNAIFVLLRTDRPQATMHRIAKNIYFATAQHAFSELRAEQSRIYAGYAGWMPGQLQAEISRGDWLIINIDPDIIFEKDTTTIWPRLNKSWSGRWL